MRGASRAGWHVSKAWEEVKVSGEGHSKQREQSRPGPGDRTGLAKQGDSQVARARQDWAGEAGGQLGGQGRARGTLERGG